MQHLTGRDVVVQTTETINRGKFVELGEKELYLQTENGWVLIPVDKIADIKEAE